VVIWLGLCGTDVEAVRTAESCRGTSPGAQRWVVSSPIEDRVAANPKILQQLGHHCGLSCIRASMSVLGLAELVEYGNGLTGPAWAGRASDGENGAIEHVLSSR
jgi:hypothetical protein